ncbi:hypothetical protein [Falsarthrobacter nasiphocae]|uniref:Uncharacterized protein n=1 Tax=Falsarthrobacter nasiphocae TaxID=189863 RepID=A0AAE3YGB6_9MICC|nr:hypothetical protein [Falsarthrobacter nasiphocae]MDR6891634.1 hypothetical protein [Falsarthrobacter nasiphocae]
MPHNPATPTHEVEPLVTRVQRAESRTEAIRILESAGFQDQLKTGRYEKSAAGLTVGFDLGPSPTVTRSMTVVWRGIKPYVRGTADDWKAALDATTTLGGAACALITNEWGSAGCIAVAGTVKDWTGRIDTSAWPAGQCLAINPRQTTDVFIEAC